MGADEKRFMQERGGSVWEMPEMSAVGHAFTTRNDYLSEENDLSDIKVVGYNESERRKRGSSLLKRPFNDGDNGELGKCSQITISNCAE